MNGAQALIHTVADAGVEVCFANPGTTELDLVQALDSAPRVRSVLCLFEGVCSAAADGYARMAAKPAMTLFHLGPGMGNAFANLHNAWRARTPMLNLVGDHMTSHVPYDAPLTTDIEAIARPFSGWLQRPATADALVQAAAEAVHAAAGPPGRIATLIAPQDACWGEAKGPAKPLARTPARGVPGETIDRAAKALRAAGGKGAGAILLSAEATGGAAGLRCLRAAHRIAAATGCRVMHEGFVARIERGAGIPVAERVPYFPEAVLKFLAGVKTLVLAGSRIPVAFFGYADAPHELMPEGCAALPFAAPGEDIAGALEALADALGAPKDGVPVAERKRPGRPTGELNAYTVGRSLAELMPENAVVMNEALSPGLQIQMETARAAPHSMMYLTGGAIGIGLPGATGAAVACPDRKVLALQSDGSGMYTLQALWTQARESLNVVNVILANRSYKILQVELARAGVTERGRNSESLTDLAHPEINWVKLGEGMGVPGTRVDTAEGFHDALARSLAASGPQLIEAMI